VPELLEGARFDLAHPLPANVKTVAQILERGRVVAQMPLAEDVALALVQAIGRGSLAADTPPRLDRRRRTSRALIGDSLT
jgi:hypothetical protein